LADNRISQSQYGYYLNGAKDLTSYSDAANASPAMQKLPGQMPSGITPDQLSGIVSNSPSFQQQDFSPEQNQMVRDLISRLRNQGR